jgi:hypothetical protein
MAMWIGADRAVGQRPGEHDGADADRTTKPGAIDATECRCSLDSAGNDGNAARRAKLLFILDQAGATAG